MKILFHLAHPAHYHLFKYTASKLSLSNEVFISHNKKDVLSYLLKSDNYNDFQKFEVRSNRKSNSYIDLLKEFIQKEYGLFKLARRLNPDLIIGTPIIIAHVGKLLSIPSIIINEDDFDAIYTSVRVGYPFASKILAPIGCRTGKFSAKTVHYNGYHELAYLHPKYFTTDIKVLNQLKLEENEKFFLLRFAKLTAHHDQGKTGITDSIAARIIEQLQDKGKVFITSERELKPEFEQYRIKIDPAEMHSVMNYATLYIGDSQTMAAEAAVLGTPSIRFNDFVGKLGYLEELEHKFNLTFGIKTSDQNKLFEKIDELLAIPNLKEEWKKRKEIMLLEKIDVTAFMVWFIENYPDSVNVMRENPGYQYRFR